jgi:uncharacterized protein YqjF (DUF2071 family)
MLAFLRDHPFAVESFFETSLVLTFAVRKEELALCIPECLELDTWDDTWAFLAVAMVKTRGLRPKGFPRFMGNDFVLTGYRIFVRYTTSKGKRLRGLFIMRSETDKQKMAIMGNIFTHYHYQKTDIAFNKTQDMITVHSVKSDLHIEVNVMKDDAQLPEASPFKDWKEARRFAGPLPFTFTYDQASKEVLIIEGVREHWIPKPVTVYQSNVGFIRSLSLKSVVLANAFVINDIPYYWKKGRKDLWRQA